MMAISNIIAEPASPCDIPRGDAVCILAIVDTTCDLTVDTKALCVPAIAGHEYLNLPTWAFLITNETKSKQVVFDLGSQKDWWNLPPPQADVVEKQVPGVRITKNLSEILVEGGQDLNKLDAAIISHHHWDHIGEPSLFPESMDVVVGPGFSKAFLPGYPTVESCPLWERAFKNRKVQEIDFSGNLKVAGYRAHDFFGDGSFYILDTPGHAIGHISALVRTTPDSFVFLGADICHFAGVLRPTKYLPLPDTLTENDLGRKGDSVQGSKFMECHPHGSNACNSSFYGPSPNGWYADVKVSQQSIDQLKVLDADDRILVIFAHDPSVIGALTFFPSGTINNWQESKVKAAVRWRFLNELPMTGKTTTRPRVDGLYRDGKKVRDLL